MLPVALLLAVVGCKKDAAEATTDVGQDLVLFEPGPGEMVPSGETALRGSAYGLHDIAVNGAPMALDGNLWTGTVDLPRGITTFEVTGRNDQGDQVYLRQSVLAGDFGDGKIAQAVAIRANRGALDAAADLVTGLLSVDDINALLPSLNPVYEDSYGAFGIDAVSIAADIGSVWFDPPSITLDPGAGAVDVRVVLPNVRVDVPVRGDVIGIDFDTNVLLEVDDAVVTGLLEVGAEDGALKATLVAPDI
ncbi:MAG: hypothetical protein R3F59_23820, partial [Myxococcota bacterium]